MFSNYSLLFDTESICTKFIKRNRLDDLEIN